MKSRKIRLHLTFGPAKEDEVLEVTVEAKGDYAVSVHDSSRGATATTQPLAPSHQASFDTFHQHEDF